MGNESVQRNQQWAKIASGSIGSVCTATAVHPLEVVKVRTQAKPFAVPSNVALCPQGCGTFVINNGLGDCTLPRSSVPYFDSATGKLKELPRTKRTGTFGTFRRILVNEGLSGLYAGLAPTLTMGVPNTVIYFLAYDELSDRLKTSDKATTWTPALAGAAARFVASFSTAPLELIRTIQASRVGAAQASGGMVAEFQNIVKNDGFLALYKGLSPTLFRDVPFSAIYWLCIEKCRKEWTNFDSDRLVAGTSTKQQAGRALFNGTISGLIAAACTTPLDVIKTRRQLQVDPLSTVHEATPICDHKGHIVYKQKMQPSSGTIDLFREILREEGINGLWKGNVARMTKVAPACACMIASYEVGQRLLLEE